VELEDLTRVPHVIPLLAEWHVREWQHLDPEWTVQAAAAELEVSTAAGVPHTVVAFVGDGRSPGEVIGSVSLIDDDELAGLEDVRPWLASLYVRSDARGNGVGRGLVNAAVAFAHDHGVERLHLFTPDRTDFYERLGWRVVASAEKNGHNVTVMTIHTHPHAPRRAFATDWCTSPWFRGAYSYLRAHGTPEDRDTLGEVFAPGLVLAGEAASRDFPGTMHGAWFSGERAAQRICAASPKSVVVVGAGLAGVAAARSAAGHGADVIVLEATSRIGGRATSSRHLGGPVNIGAAWIHGTEGHPLTEPLARRTDRLETNTFRQMTTFLAGQGELAGAELDELARLNGEIERRISAATVTACTGDVVGDVLFPAIDEVASDERAATVLRSWLRGEYENLYAAPPSDLSLLHAAEPFRLPGPDVMMTVAADELVGELADGLAIAFDSPVRSITRRGESWCVSTDGRDVVADAVVVTVPLGALKAGAIELQPPLPPRTLAAMDRIGAGLVTKAFFSFDNAFWAPRRAIWIAAEPPAVFELWVDVSAVRGAPTLCAFAVGDDARRVEQMSDDELLDAAWTTLLSATDLVPGGADGSRAISP
jgi:monoamine oxidase/GNAT superfamily N-acetyltransferase